MTRAPTVYRLENFQGVYLFDFGDDIRIYVDTFASDAFLIKNNEMHTLVVSGYDYEEYDEYKDTLEDPQHYVSVLPFASKDEEKEYEERCCL